VDVLVCGAQKPFVYGGAEQHQENLVAAFRAAGHQPELVRLPVAWEKDRLFDAPLAWRMIPADADLVVATNFPSYFVRHPRKVVWLFHQHRGAYELADEAFSDIGMDDPSFEVQRRLAEWDSRALGEAAKIFTTSQTVADRLSRFNGLTGEPLYHPPPLADRLHPGPTGDYLFCATRLEHNKRPEKILQAALGSTHRIRAVVAGRGTLAGELEELARTGPSNQVELAGFVDDETVVDLYANALGVVYAPLDEDYGYATLQAFFAGKPVITATDSGGVLEFVEDGVTGYVTDGSPEQLAAAADRLAADPEHAAEMGAEGRRRVEAWDWPAVVDCLVAGANGA
jgi:glycosyltransferase involved in cell wall biosynthesis